MATRSPIGTEKFKVTAIKDPTQLPWKELGIDIALECTGIFTARDKAAAHLTAGAKRVIVSAPADGADLTVVYGINHDKLTKDHIVISNASCTTNCLAPLAAVLHEAVGIEKGMMTTIHSYTGDQPTLDTMHKDLYRARAAALSQIPTSTGAAKAIGLVLPELKGKLDGISIRVPTPNVSVVDFKFIAKRNDHRPGDQRRAHRGRRRQAQGRAGRHPPSERLDRLQPRSAFLDHGARPDQGDGRQLRLGAVLVRQRVGLLQPHGRHRGRLRQDHRLTATSASRDSKRPARRAFFVCRRGLRRCPDNRGIGKSHLAALHWPCLRRTLA